MELLKNALTVQNITGIIALSVVVSSIISTLISGIMNLISQNMSQKHERKMKYWFSYYEKCTHTLTSLLESAGKLFANPDTDEEILNTMSWIYQSYAYADKQLSETLDCFYSKLEAWNNDIDNINLLNDSQKYMITVARDINRLLIRCQDSSYMSKRLYN